MIKSRLLVFSLVLLFAWRVQAQVTSFEGIDASTDPNPEHDVDPNGAIGTLQYLEWTNVALEAFDKSGNPVWNPAVMFGVQPFKGNGLTDCDTIYGDGYVLFDRLASRWVVSGHNNPSGSQYSYCIAVSNTDDLSSSGLLWYTYEFSLAPFISDPGGYVYFPDWPKVGTWSDGYYLSFDIMDASNHYRIIGVGFCVMDRTDMLAGGTANPIQCVTNPSPLPTHGQGALYLGHSPEPADIDGTTAPPAGQDEMFVSIQNPLNDGKTTTSNSINVWDFQNLQSGPIVTQYPITVTEYTPGCYNVKAPANTNCALQPGTNKGGHHYLLDGLGDRIMARFAYRNFGAYQSYMVSHTVRVGKSSAQTGVRWYELRNYQSTGIPSLYQGGTVNPAKPALFRFMPSIAQDKAGNVAVGYSVSSVNVHPGIRASTWSLTKKFKPVETDILDGGGDSENSPDWGDYTSMTVDPVDDCTFWYVNEYLPSNETGTDITWQTRIANFKLANCQ